MIQTYPDAEAVSVAAAELFAEKARQATEARGRFSVSLSGGSTPKRVYELLAQPPLRDQVPWEKVHIFWGDERCVPADDARSNAHMTRAALLDHVPVPPAQIHAIDGTVPARDAANCYEELLRQFFAGQPPRFDLVLLGLGENGHTASLFPHTPVLREQERWVSPINILDIGQLTGTATLDKLLPELQRAFEIVVPTDDLQTMPKSAEVLAAVERELLKKEQVLERVTMTAPLLNQAALVAFLVTGRAKSKVLREVIENPVDCDRLPAQLVRPEQGELRWLVDKGAAARLKKKTG